jgi:hypothetical protein
MSLRSIPVDADRIRFVVIDVEPVADFAADGTRNGKQRADQDGIPLWRVNTLAMVEGVAGGETTPVRIAADYAPTLAPLSQVRFLGLTARPWSQGDRNGVSLVAAGIEGQDTPARPRKAADATVGGES